MKRNIKYIVNAVRWFDRINGNTYHSVRISRTKDDQIIVSSPIVYGYDDFYRQTALSLMAKSKWLPVKYRGKNENGSSRSYLYERENNYPIIWHVTDGLKRDMTSNVC